MKTIKIFLIISTLAFTTSCGNYYRMVTTIDRDGSAYREIYAWGDSAFMSGNNLSNPFLFELSSDWNVNRYDTAFRYNSFDGDKKFNVIISKKTNSIENYSKDVRCNANVRSFAAPEESLVKKTGWFYKNYLLRVVYKKIPYKAPIPIDNYLSKEEQILWTQGGMNNYKAMNGTEMNDYLNEISDKFMKWYGRNLFEFSISGIKKMTENYDLDRDKENIYKKWSDSVKIDTVNMDSKTVCTILDSFYKTSYFSKLYNANHELLDRDFNQQTTPIDSIIDNEISYELVIPGEILQTNAPVFHSDTLVWKIDGVRLLFNDYSIETNFRIINKWSLVLTGLLLIIAIGSIIVLGKRRRPEI